MVTQIFRTVAGDFNLDGRVDGADYVFWRNSGSVSSGALYTQGDADFDGDVDSGDLTVLRSRFGFVRQPLSPGAGSGALAAAVPEPTTIGLLFLAGGVFAVLRGGRRASRLPQCVVRNA